MSERQAVCYCDDGSVVAAIIRRGPEGLNLCPASAILGHGQAEYGYPVGIPNAQEITCLSSFNGAWAHIRLKSEACLLKIDSGPDLPRITLYHGVDLYPDQAFRKQGISTEQYKRESLSVHPWEDARFMPLYQVQVESQDMILSCEVVAEPGEAADLALQHFQEFLGKNQVWASVTSCSVVGWAPGVTPPGKVVRWELS